MSMSQPGGTIMTGKDLLLGVSSRLLAVGQKT
jgi:hypothetical protein